MSNSNRQESKLSNRFGLSFRSTSALTLLQSWMASEPFGRIRGLLMDVDGINTNWNPAMHTWSFTQHIRL